MGQMSRAGLRLWAEVKQIFGDDCFTWEVLQGLAELPTGIASV